MPKKIVDKNKKIELTKELLVQVRIVLGVILNEEVPSKESKKWAKKVFNKKEKIVQIKNPKSGSYVKIDTSTGRILSYKKTPYKNIPIVGEIVGEVE